MLYFKYACLHDFGFSKMFVLKIKNLASDGDQNMPFTVEPRKGFAVPLVNCHFWTSTALTRLRSCRPCDGPLPKP